MANPVGRIKAIVIDSDTQARIRLKSATQSVVQFQVVDLHDSIDEVLARLENSGHIDIIFISRRFSQREIDAFIERAKQTPGGQDSAYVIVLGTSKQDSQQVARNVLSGADGFLLEPFSVDNLAEITSLAARVKMERSQQREAAALRFLIRDVMKQLDKLAYIKKWDFEVGSNMRHLKEMCSVFHALEKETLEIYYEIMATEFSNARIPIFPEVPKVYGGASKRVRQKIEAKVLKQLGEELRTEE